MRSVTQPTEGNVYGARAGIGNVETKKWLATNKFTHFVTLATNTSSVREKVMRDRLRAWDARVNRALYGPKWQKHQDELIWFHAFLEKPKANPHWHLLLRLVGRLGSDRNDEFNRLPVLAENTWLDLVPSGSVDVQEIEDESLDNVVAYVAKELRYELQYQNFVTPDEFRRF